MKTYLHLILFVVLSACSALAADPPLMKEDGSLVVNGVVYGQAAAPLISREVSIGEFQFALTDRLHKLISERDAAIEAQKVKETAANKLLRQLRADKAAERDKEAKSGKGAKYTKAEAEEKLLGVLEEQLTKPEVELEKKALKAQIDALTARLEEVSK